MAFIVSCQCGKRYQLNDESAGSVFACSGCGSQVHAVDSQGVPDQPAVSDPMPVVVSESSPRGTAARMRGNRKKPSKNTPIVLAVVGAAFAVAILVIVIALSSQANRVTQANYDRIKQGMSYQEVVHLLGKPTSIEKDESRVPGIPYTERHFYQGPNATIVINYLNDIVGNAWADGSITPRQFPIYVKTGEIDPALILRDEVDPKNSSSGAAQ